MSSSKDVTGKDSSTGPPEGQSGSILIVNGRRFPINPRICLALAGQTFRCCIRRRVLLVLVMFVAFLLVSYWVAPKAFPVKRLELLIRASLMFTSFFAVIVMVFLSATTVPDDINSRTIFTVLTKPVGRLNYLLGRVAGLSLTALMLLLVMGFMSVGLIRYTAWRAGGGESPKAEQTGALLIARRHACPRDITLRLEPTSEDIAPPIDISTDKKKLSGEWSRTMVFYFRGRDLAKRCAEPVTVSFGVEVHTGARLPKCEVLVLARNPATGRKSEQRTLLDSRRRSTVTFAADLVDPELGMELQLRRLSPGVILTDLDGVTVVLSPVIFEFAFAKALAMIFFGLVALIVIGLTASTYMSRWLAVLITFMAYLVGVFSEVFRALIVKLSTGAGSPGLLGTTFFAPSELTQGEPSGLIAFLNDVYLVLFRVITFIIPDFRKFDAKSLITGGYDVPPHIWGTALWYAVVFSVVYLSVAYLLMNRREVGL